MSTALPPDIELALRAIAPPDRDAMAASRARLDGLTKPTGSLGRLEDLAVDLAGITGDPAWEARPRTVAVFAADHGVVAQGVSAYPAAVTGQMVANFLGGGAAINALAGMAQAELVVVDVGVASAFDVPAQSGVRFVSRPIAQGTADMTLGPAMTRNQALAAIRAGLEIAANEIGQGTRLLAVGEMGIGNTTAASAITAVMTGRSAAEVTGTGAGLDELGRARKVAAIERALAVNHPDAGDPIGVLACVGGFEIGALVGAIVGAAAARRPVLLDGFITGAAALLAAALSREAGFSTPPVIASHRSAEPGHAAALDHLGLRPLLDLGLRLGEGSGAALALGLVDAARAVRDEMATFESAQVSGPR
jgi:nicotinate-nucleotide--dimethylbenzimidazole phosphoribosyltransferase